MTTNGCRGLRPRVLAPAATNRGSPVEGDHGSNEERANSGRPVRCDRCRNAVIRAGPVRPPERAAGTPMRRRSGRSVRPGGQGAFQPQAQRTVLVFPPRGFLCPRKRIAEFPSDVIGAETGNGRASTDPFVVTQGETRRAGRRYTRTDGGRFRSNMWTVSTKRTCFVR